MKIVVLVVLLWLPVVNCDWQLQKKGVCFGAKGSSFGTFKLRKSGTIRSIKLVHESGEVKCSKQSDGSFWGCNEQKLATVITDTDNKILFPKSAVNEVWFTVSPYTSKSKELIYKTPASTTFVEAGQTLRLWYAEDLKHHFPSDNSGKSCAAVYAVITQDLTLEDTIKIIEDQNKQIQALTKLIDAERKIIEKLKTDFKVLVNKQRKQEEAVKNRIAKVETEMQDLVNKQRKQEEAVKNRTEKVETEMQELRQVTYSGLGGECDPDKAIYFPRDTTQHKMQQCYTFHSGDAPYNLHFVGYGHQGIAHGLKSYSGISFDTCVTRCEALRRNDFMWNGMNYEWKNNTCRCYRNMQSIDPDTKNSGVLYSFTS